MYAIPGYNCSGTTLELRPLIDQISYTNQFYFCFKVKTIYMYSFLFFHMICML